MTKNKYEHLINFNYPYKTNRKKMTVNERAAQFMPFSALTGHKEAIIKSNRITTNRLSLDQSKIDEINLQLSELALNPDFIYITFFKEDLEKSGGNYYSEYVEVLKVDELNQQLITNIGTIKFIDILDINR